MGKHGYNHGDFGWNELTTDNPEEAVAFYSNLIGWKVEDMEMPDGSKYSVLVSGEEKVGGISAKQEDQAGTPSAWMPYITVNDVDETAGKVESLGGKILSPPCDIPVENGPRMSVIQDPGGATLGIISYVTSSED